MLREAFGFPRNRDGAARDLLVGGLLVLASGLVIPGLILYGYLLRVMDAGARGRDVPPTLGGWGRLLVDGLKATVVTFVYGILPVVVMAAGIAAASAVVFGRTVLYDVRAGTVPSIAGTTHAELGLLAAVGGVLALAVIVLALHLPAALVALATQGRLRAAFRTGALWAVVSKQQYVAGIVSAAVVFVVGLVVVTPLVAALVGLVLYFYLLVVVAYLIGRTVGGAAVTAIRPANRGSPRPSAGR